MCIRDRLSITYTVHLLQFIGVYIALHNSSVHIDLQNVIFMISGKSVQKKWKNLQNSFAREVAKRKTIKTGSGRSWKTYMYFDQMLFLMPTMRHAEDVTGQNLGYEFCIQGFTGHNLSLIHI